MRRFNADQSGQQRGVGRPAGDARRPSSRSTEAVEALESANDASAGEDEDAVPAEDVTTNPDTDQLEELPGPSGDAPNESAG